MFIDQCHCLSTAPSTVFDCTADSRENKFSGLSEKVFSRELGRSLDRLRLHSRRRRLLRRQSTVDCSRRVIDFTTPEDKMRRHVGSISPVSIPLQYLHQPPPLTLFLPSDPSLIFCPFVFVMANKRPFPLQYLQHPPPLTHSVCALVKFTSEQRAKSRFEAVVIFLKSRQFLYDY